ncbi:MAG: hypothetical protein JXQ72_12695 [Anaerolineae bacterium]|nr:hypothetical protein [Anaerolineae bacterium]
MKEMLYVTNFPPDTPDEQLRELFADQGDVLALERGLEEKSGRPYALITMASEKIATKANNATNGHLLDGYHLAVSYPEVDAGKDLTSRQRRVLDELKEKLEETDKVPVRRLEAIVRLCGTSFAQALMEEALALEASDSALMLGDGSRKRTKGGHFFYLARYRVAPPIRRIIYNRKGKMPAEEPAE